MRILILGKNGQLGWELDHLLKTNQDVTSLDYPEVDLGDSDLLRSILDSLKPEIIINAGAYTVVDQAEIESEKAFAINAQGPGVLAEIAKSMNSVLIHYSTDYVFDGLNGPYQETDMPTPINQYGKSKLEGENVVSTIDGTYLILRTSWVYNLRSNNFVTRVIKWAREKEIIKIVDDQISNPTLARDLAIATASLISQAGDDFQTWFNERKGLYHLAGDGFVSRYGWAQKILELDPSKDQHMFQSIIPVGSETFPTPAKRPLFTALDCQKFSNTFGFHLPGWAKSLQIAMKTSSTEIED